ncbi:MAG: PQQ-binding-like beta-propeller repeat protein [Planctomycetota bacterium]
MRKPPTSPFTLLLISILSVSLFSQSALAQDHWPQWRGPHCDGLAGEGSCPPIVWDEKNLKWETPIEGFGHGTPAVYGDRIFLQTAIPLDIEMPVPDVIPPGTPDVETYTEEATVSWKPQRFALVCLDRQSGEQLWSRTVLEAMPHQGHHLKGSFASQSPVTNGEKVYAFFGSYGLYCFDFDGNLIWQRAPEPQAKEGGLGEATSPALHENKLVVVVDQQTQSYVMALDATTGDEVWRTDREDPSNWTTPRIFEHGGRVQVAVNGTSVISYDLQTGIELWRCSGHTAGAIPIPAIGHGLIFTASGWNKDYLQAIRLGEDGDLTGTDAVIWSIDNSSPYVPCPTLWGDELYVLEDRSFISAYNAIDGTRLYKQRLPGMLNFSASPTGAGNWLYLLSEEGTAVVIARGPEFRILAVNELNDPLFASPAIAGNCVYVRGAESLYCFVQDEKDQQEEHREEDPDDEESNRDVVPLETTAGLPAESGIDSFLGEASLGMKQVFKGERFPNVVVATDGTVIATWGSASIRARRSEDGGESWGDEIVIADPGFQGGGVTVDESSGSIFAFAEAAHPPADILVSRSDDHGRSWQPVEVTIRPDADGNIPSMHMNERGITLRHGNHRGRLIRPTRWYAGKNDSEKWPDHYTNAMYSDDGGRTWQTSAPFPANGTGEAAIAELSDGRLYYNSRRHWAEEGANPLRRWTAWSDDGGETWGDLQICEALPDGPQNTNYGCMGGLVRIPVKDRDVLIYSNCDSEDGRHHGTVWASFDGGQTWPVKRLIFEGAFAYSSLTAGRPETASDGWIYCHFEGGPEGGSTVARFNLAWIIEGELTGDGVIPEFNRPAP